MYAFEGIRSWRKIEVVEPVGFVSVSDYNIDILLLPLLGFDLDFLGNSSAFSSGKLT